MIVVSHPTGNANVRGLLNGLHKHQLLATYCTTLGFSSRSKWLNLLPAGLKKELNRRSYDLPSCKMKSRPWLEIRRLAEGRLKLSAMRIRKPRLSVDQVYTDLDQYVANIIKRDSFINNAKAIYGYEDGCRDSFRAARTKGWHCFYELPIGYWRAAKKILEEEAGLNPAWAASIPTLRETEKKLERKEEELRLASHVIVASKFTLNTLDLLPGEKPARISIIPYGAPQVYYGPLRRRSAGDTLKVLFVGGLSQRKGLSYLFDAVEESGSSISLTVIGRCGNVNCPELEKHLNRHNWIESLPHSDILECMRNHDVFIFPSMFEGFGLVILEALSQGLPVITTPHTAGPDILTEGKDGFIVPIRSSTAIKEKLEILYRDQELLMEMKRNAIAKAEQFTWKRYEDAIAAVLSDLLRTKAAVV